MKQEIIMVTNYEAAHLEQLIPADYDGPVIAGYIRVSTDDQADEGHSLQVQIERISDLVKTKFPDGHLLLIFSDPGLSGTLHYKKTSGSDQPIRPGLQGICQVISRHRVDFVAVYKCNRLARNPRVWFDFLEDYLKRFNVGLIASEEEVDLNNPGGQFVANVLMAASKFERDQIVGACRDGVRKRQQEGYVLGQPPYGWELVPAVYGPKKRRSTIRPHRDQAPIVKRIFNEYLAGYSTVEIASSLNLDGVPTYRNVKSGWLCTTVGHVLSNQTNAGLVLDLEGNRVKGQHYEDRIIEPEIFHLVEARRRSRAKVSTATKSRFNQIYGSVIHCSTCDRSMQTRNGYYYCLKCGTKTLTPIEACDSFIEGSLVGLSTTPALRSRVLEQIQTAASSDLNGASEERAAVVARLEKNRAAIVEWAQKLDSGVVKHEVYKIVEEEHVRERATLTRRLKELETILGRQDSTHALVQSALSRLERAGGLFSSLDIHEKRELASVLDVKANISQKPGGTMWSVTVLGGDRRQRSFKRAPAVTSGRPPDGLLAVAKGLLDGLSAREIADARQVDYRSVRQQMRGISERGGGSLETGLAIMRPYTSNADVATGGRRARHVRFTASEIRVLEDLALGMRNWEIAAHIDLSERAVKAARARLNQKLGTHGWQTVVEARRRGLIAGPRSECKITAQEQFVLERLAQRAKTSEIAKEMNLGREALKSLLKRLRRKLGARNLCELVENAISKGLVNP